MAEWKIKKPKNEHINAVTTTTTTVPVGSGISKEPAAESRDLGTLPDAEDEPPEWNSWNYWKLPLMELSEEELNEAMAAPCPVEISEPLSDSKEPTNGVVQKRKRQEE
jgi:hypothetical protein